LLRRLHGLAGGQAAEHVAQGCGHVDAGEQAFGFGLVDYMRSRAGHGMKCSAGLEVNLFVHVGLLSIFQQGRWSADDASLHACVAVQLTAAALQR
jgi:hypothetical protein